MSCGSGISSPNGLLWCDLSLKFTGFPPEGTALTPIPLPLPKSPFLPSSSTLASLLSLDSYSNWPYSWDSNPSPPSPQAAALSHYCVLPRSTLAIFLSVHSCPSLLSRHHLLPIILFSPSAQGHFCPLIVANTWISLIESLFGGEGWL